MSDFLFIAGIPATGKSCFGEWLRKNHSFIHLDLDNLNREWSSIWNNYFTSRFYDVPSFTQELKNKNSSIVIDWGFKVLALPVVEAFKSAGFNMWWFNADHKIARLAFIKRGGGEDAEFDSQVNDINREWRNINNIFSPNIIENALNLNMEYMHSQNIYNHIFGNVRQ